MQLPHYARFILLTTAILLFAIGAGVFVPQLTNEYVARWLFYLGGVFSMAAGLSDVLLTHLVRREPNAVPPGSPGTPAALITAHQIIAGGNVAVGITSVVQAAEPAVCALYQLPAPPGDFTGRADQLEALQAAVEEGGAVIAGMHGMGGVGKTALALVLAQRLTPRFPDAQFCLYLRGTSGDPLPPAAAMAQVIRGYHPAVRLPESPDELATLYRSVLTGQRALLLMDNAADVAQVTPLVPPAGNALLVTSRRHFTLPGMRTCDLEALPPDEARQLLLCIAPRIGTYADEIAGLCGCLPLALRLAGSRMAERRDLSPEDYIQRLSAARTRFDEVDAAIEVSYALLRPDQQSLWRMLAVFPATFDRAAARAVWEIEEDAAQDALGELVSASLLEWDEAAARYRMHDLVRLAAGRWLEDEERMAAGLRQAAYFLTILGAADALFLKGGADVLRGLALFDGEWDNVRAGQAWAAARAEEDEAAARLCSAYPDAGVYCLSLRRHPQDQVVWLQAAVAAARRLGDRRGEGNHVGNLGTAFRDLGQVEKAIAYYEQALIIAREIGDRRGEANRLGNLGLAYSVLGQVEKAMGYYEQALVIAREIGDRSGVGADLGNLGLAYSALGQVEKAIEYLRQALVIAREIGDRRNEGAYLVNLGNAFSDLGQVETARGYHEQALVISREIGDRRGEGADLGSLGLSYSALGQVEKAIAYHEQALVIASETGDRRGEGNHLGNLGNAYGALGQVESAIAYHEQALVISREIGDRRGEGTDLGNLGTAYYALGQVEKAIGYHEQALVIAREIRDRRGEGNHLANLGTAYHALGQVEKAVDYISQALAIFEEIKSPYAEHARRQLDELAA